MTRAAPRLLVTHPGRQHSHQEALALERAGRLAGYWSGVPSVAAHLETLKGHLLGRFIRYPPVDLDPARARWAAHPPVLRRAGDLLLRSALTGSLTGRLADRVDFAACRAFDRWAAGRLGTVGAGAVIACEISALTTFREARRRGWATLLDAPSFHHAAQDRLHGFTESPALHRRIVAVKEAEIEAADHILTVSELARSTYLDAGVDPDRVHAVSLGADLELFTPDGPRRPDALGEPLFLFAGAAIHRKGFDLLLDAFARVHRAVPGARLRLVGPPGDSSPLLERAGEGVEAVGPVPQADLAVELRSADCLVLPSRNDSFGMVVAEALASGTPVIVSTMVGAKDLLRAPGGDACGWTVPVEDAEALAERMLACARDPEALCSLAGAARRAAETATWESYYLRFAALIERLLP